ncbi:MAG: DUF177 domain-containing protein [Cyclobacteriaceae bacterium]
MEKELRNFTIEIVGLSDEVHDFQYEIKDSFFKFFESQLVEKGQLNANLALTKTERHIQIEFDIQGEVELECDRSVEKFNYPIATKDTVIFRYAETYEEIDENLVNIPFGQQEINVAQYVYDLIMIAIPLKKLHPRYKGKDDELTIYTTFQETDREDIEEEGDPRWNDLKKLLNKKLI